MTKIRDLESHNDAELLIQELTPSQAENILAGYCLPNENCPYSYIINITRNPSKPATSKPESKPEGTTITGQKINSIDDSRKTYINGVPIKGDRNIIIIY